MSTFWDKENDGLWREGPYLVVRKRGAVFPDRCIVCNQPGYRAKLTFNFYGETSPLAVPANFVPFLGFLIPGDPTHYARAKVWFCQRHRCKERFRQFVSILLGFGGLSGLAMVCVLTFAPWMQQFLQSHIVVGFLGVFSILVLYVWFFYFRLRARPVYGVYVKDGFAWIANVNPDFLDALPEV